MPTSGFQENAIVWRFRRNSTAGTRFWTTEREEQNPGSNVQSLCQKIKISLFSQELKSTHGNAVCFFFGNEIMDGSLGTRSVSMSEAQYISNKQDSFWVSGLIFLWFCGKIGYLVKTMGGWHETFAFV